MSHRSTNPQAVQRTVGAQSRTSQQPMANQPAGRNIKYTPSARNYPSQPSEWEICIALYCMVLYCMVLYYVYCIGLYCMVLYCAVCIALSYILLFCIVFCTVLYCIVHIVLYCTVRHYNTVNKDNFFIATCLVGTREFINIFYLLLIHVCTCKCVFYLWDLYVLYVHTSSAVFIPYNTWFNSLSDPKYYVHTFIFIFYFQS